MEQIRRECARISAELQLLESAGSARQEEMLLVVTERNEMREQLKKAHVQLGDLEARYQQRLTELDSSGACARTHMCAHTHCAHSACPLCVLCVLCRAVHTTMKGARASIGHGTCRTQTSELVCGHRVARCRRWGHVASGAERGRAPRRPHRRTSGARNG